MAITTGDAVPGEVIEAAWGDAVRADLTSLDTTRVKKAGDTMTGSLYVGGPPSAGAGVQLVIDGRVYSSMIATTAANLILGRGGSTTGAPGQPLAWFNRSAGTTNPLEVLVGSITLGAGGSSVVYNTTSDKRLKELSRAVDPDEALAKVGAMEPVHYTRTDNPEAGELIGFFAQDLDAVAPEAVTPGSGEPGDGSPDPQTGEGGFIPWMVDLSTLVPTLVAAIHALTARVAALEAT